MISSVPSDVLMHLVDFLPTLSDWMSLHMTNNHLKQTLDGFSSKAWAIVEPRFRKKFLQVPVMVTPDSLSRVFRLARFLCDICGECNIKYQFSIWGVYVCNPCLRQNTLRYCSKATDAPRDRSWGHWKHVGKYGLPRAELTVFKETRKITCRAPLKVPPINLTLPPSPGMSEYELLMENSPDHPLSKSYWLFRVARATYIPSFGLDWMTHMHHRIARTVKMMEKMCPFEFELQDKDIWFLIKGDLMKVYEDVAHRHICSIFDAPQIADLFPESWKSVELFNLIRHRVDGDNLTQYCCDMISRLTTVSELVMSRLNFLFEDTPKDSILSVLNSKEAKDITWHFMKRVELDKWNVVEAAHALISHVSVTFMLSYHESQALRALSVHSKPCLRCMKLFGKLCAADKATRCKHCCFIVNGNGCSTHNVKRSGIKFY